MLKGWRDERFDSIFQRLEIDEAERVENAQFVAAPETKSEGEERFELELKDYP